MISKTWWIRYTTNAAYKHIYPTVKHCDAQLFVKNDGDEIKYEPNVKELVKSKIAEWKRQFLKRKSSLLSYWGNVTKRKENTGSAKDAGSTSSDTTESKIEIITPPPPLLPPPPPPPPENSSDKAPSSTTTSAPPPPLPSPPVASPAKKKSCHATNEIDAKIVPLTEEIKKLEEVINLNIISNIDKTRVTVKSKKAEIDSLLKRMKTLTLNRINKK